MNPLLHQLHGAQQPAPPSDLPIDNHQTLSTAFSLWASQKRQQSPHLRPRRLKRMWIKLRNAEKRQWRTRMRQLQEPAAAATAPPAPPTPATLRSDQIIVSQCTPSNAAAHLSLLGDSLHRMGGQLMQHDGNQCSVSGALSVLLDAFLCSMGPLMALTREIPGVEENPLLDAAISSTLDNIAYILPGL